MNAIQLRSKIDFYNNISRSARFFNYEYDNAVNIAIIQAITLRLGDEGNRKPENFQWVQTIRDDMFTLIKTATPTITTGSAITNKYYTSIPSTIPKPSDYRDFILLMVLIDGFTSYSRPTTYNEIGPLLENSFMHPTNEKTYYNENATGLTIWRGSGGTFTTATLTYLKIPATFTVGLETQYINTGGTLTNAAVYYATEQSVYATVTYKIGDTITGTGAALTSGQVILASNTTPVELPDKIHDEIAIAASAIMLGTLKEFDSSMFSEKQAGDSN